MTEEQAEYQKEKARRAEAIIGLLKRNLQSPIMASETGNSTRISNAWTERIEELEAENESLKTKLNDIFDKWRRAEYAIHFLEAENKRLREALEEIINSIDYSFIKTIAREALK